MLVIQKALALAALGWAVFPCEPGGKAPLTFNGFKDATTDPEVIKALWAKCPNANIGTPIPAGYCVIDEDPRNGGRLEDLPSLPDTFTVSTGGGGRHAFFAIPEGHKLPGKLAQGIDGKNSESGYVIAVGSTHESGKEYSVLHAAPIAPLPQWALDMCRRPGDVREAQQIREGTKIPSTQIQALVDIVTPYYIEGRKHDLARSLGGWLRQRGWDEDSVEEAVRLLPSQDPDARVQAALFAFGDGVESFGWTNMCDIVGEDVANRWDSQTANPEKDFVTAMAQTLAKAPPVQTELPTRENNGMIARLRALRYQGPPMPLGPPGDPLTQSLRGGLRNEKIMIVGGAPGAGKTSYLRQIGDYLCRQDVAVGWLAIDEEPSAIDIRRLQALGKGITREDAENPTEELLTGMAQDVANLPFVVFDSSTNWMLENALTYFSEMYRDMPRVFIIDSLQTAQTTRSAGLNGRERIDDVLATIKRMCREEATKCAVIATSELARGSYRSESGADATNDLAAFKESGSIEYQGHVLCLMRNIPGDSGVVHVAQPKNRLGVKMNYLLAFDRTTTDFTQTFEDPRETAKAAATEATTESVLGVISKSVWPGMSLQQIKNATQLRPTQITEIIQQLVASHEILMASGHNRQTVWRLASTRPPEPEPSAMQIGSFLATSLGVDHDEAFA